MRDRVYCVKIDSFIVVCLVKSEAVCVKILCVCCLVCVCCVNDSLLVLMLRICCPALQESFKHGIARIYKEQRF